MGWPNCGNDSKGRPIGYGHSGTCDKEGCGKEIDRGLTYACGGMHGEDEISCEHYFCADHLYYTVEVNSDFHKVCSNCALELLSSGDWWYNSEEVTIQRINHNEESDINSMLLEPTPVQRGLCHSVDSTVLRRVPVKYKQLVIFGAVVAVMLLLSFVLPTDDSVETIQSEYCEMWQLYKDTGGEFGWPDPDDKAKEFCK